MSDIVERLRGDVQYEWRQIMRDAASEIERLRSRVAELEAAAKELADGWTYKHVVNTDLDRRVVNMILARDRPRCETKRAELHRAANGEVGG